MGGYGPAGYCGNAVWPLAGLLGGEVLNATPRPWHLAQGYPFILGPNDETVGQPDDRPLLIAAVNACARLGFEDPAELEAAVRELVGAVRLAWDGPHIAEFTESGWSLAHPLRCRPNLQDCQVHRMMMKLADHYKERRGRYEVIEEGDGLRVMAAKWVGEDPAVAIGAALAPFAHMEVPDED